MESYKKLSLTWRILLPCVVLFIVFGVVFFLFDSMKSARMTTKELNTIHTLGYAYLNDKYPGDWSIRDEKLYKGDKLMEGETEIVDKIQSEAGAAATIFRGDTRVATCVKKEGKRAVGTKVAPNVEEAVLKGGGEFVGDAEVVGKIHRTKYVPIKDKNGKIVGMWFVGVDKHEFRMDSIKLTGFIFLMITVCILVMTFLARAISSGIRNTLDQMNETAHQVADASSQVSASSQSLAEGASEQASALEETSSSLEEMSSMTKQNAGNAAQADGLMKQASQVIQMANESMVSLTKSMTEITAASEETSKIIKTIDEIAFQTNLLALNAAVEAARAGEAGAGFAVVADEVRNLAIRAAQAAKNTAGLIEGTVKKIKDGSNLVVKANEAFVGVSTSTSKVGELVGEIAAASQEQSRGIDQINKAVAEMDKVTQRTAATAEESASASEEMNAQAEQMKQFTYVLTGIIDGSHNDQ
jgi:methyl-accepting chemotaxis protein